MTAKPRPVLTSPPSGGGRPATRRAVAGLAAGILAAGVLGGTAASGLPGTSGDGALDGTALAAAAPRADAPLSIGRVGGSLTSTPQTLDQIFALLARAEHAAHDSGRQITPAISQAAAELGMLLTTYLAQQDPAGAAAPAPEGLVLEEPVPGPAVLAPVAPATPDPAEPGVPAEQADQAPVGAEGATQTDHVVAEAPVPADPAQPDPAPADLPDAGETPPETSGAPVPPRPRPPASSRRRRTSRPTPRPPTSPSPRPTPPRPPTSSRRSPSTTSCSPRCAWPRCSTPRAPTASPSSRRRSAPAPRP
ncbi:hypothetical protein [Xylanimonas protaetiae]|uniref:Uncharacterized protein n=1 Tax=Xylanimonas protaetiae TaxID=2509457 RepID=A0A4P6F8I2_9MICO|nr:hypothetical protein [Xylanimonas protaetiae]QAY69597.1 hypothetical protein ET471_05700 [Xylanimonas protaetiae]